jgi:putative spermidine/putrescine transport system permease protein
MSTIAMADPAEAAVPERTTPLKAQLRRAERLKKLRYGALIAPLAIFLLFSFVWPIASLMRKSVDNPEVQAGLPLTARALQGWTGQALPDDAVYRAMATDLREGKGSEALAATAKRLNMERPGLRSLVMNSARKLSQPADEAGDAPPAGEPAPAPVPSTDKLRLIELDARWGELDTWQLVARNSHPTTSYYLLAALDHHRDETGHIAALPESEAVFVDVFARTLGMSLVVTMLCLVLGFPVAYLLSKLPARSANLLMICVLLPFWTSVLVRVASWIVILQDGGLINQALLALGLINQPLALVFNRVGVYIAMVHILLPFMILPLYSVMKGISPVYLRAAVSLGCPPFKSFWRIYFPMTVPGLAAGAILVFIMSIGYYITPALLGGPKEQMVSYFVAFYTNETVNWGMAAALSALLLIAISVLYAVYNRLVGNATFAAKSR